MSDATLVSPASRHLRSSNAARRRGGPVDIGEWMVRPEASSAWPCSAPLTGGSRIRRVATGPSRRTVLFGSGAFVLAGNAAHGAGHSSGVASFPMKNPEISSVPITTEHVTIRSAKPFEAVRAALEAALPSIDNAYVQLLAAGKVDAARDLLGKQAPLSIFGTRNHGRLLQVAGLQRRAIQYDIGNPLTASPGGPRAAPPRSAGSGARSGTGRRRGGRPRCRR